MIKKAIVLGGTSAHIEVLKKLKEAGYYTYVLDYTDNPVAKPYADEHIKKSTLDPKEVYEAALETGATLVLSACADQANISACYAAEKLGLSHPYSYETALAITNKAEMKRVMVANNIPTTKYVYVDSNQELDISNLNISLPVMVKPVDNHGATGVKKASTKEELKLFFEEARNFSRSGRVVVEEYFNGTEVSAYTIVRNHKAEVVMISERLNITEGEQVLKCYATITPPAISDTAKRKIQEASDKIAAAFNLDNTPLHVQAIVSGDEISIIEFAARVAGGLSTWIIKQQFGVDMLDAAIDSYCERPIQYSITPDEAYYAVNLVYGSEGIFDHFEGVDELLDEGIIYHFVHQRSKGSAISNAKANGCRLAAYVIKAGSYHELCALSQESLNRIIAVDSSGNDITRHELIIKEEDI